MKQVYQGLLDLVLFLFIIGGIVGVFYGLAEAINNLFIR